MLQRLFTLGILVISTVTCTVDNENPKDNLHGSYMGLTPPGNIPELFLPSPSYNSNTSWWWRSTPAFSPNGNEMYYTRFFYSTQKHEIWYTKITNDKWTEPQKVSFSTTIYDSDVQFLGSNDTIYFYSRRPENFIFRTTRTSSGWSEPVPLEIPLPANSGLVSSFAIANSKTIYFAMLEGTGYNWASADIYITKYVDGQYTQPENIGSPINIANVGESVAYVDPSERFMIFSSTKSGGLGSYDLYISCKNQDGIWEEPINLGSKINSGGEEDKFTITPDGKYIFFTTLNANSYSPYWMDINGVDSITSF